MATKAEYAEDLKRSCGALISIEQLINYGNMNRKWWQKLLDGVDTVGSNTGKRYFYKDVAERLARY